MQSGRCYFEKDKVKHITSSLRIIYGISMVNYWLCVTNEDNWQVVKRQKIWGAPAKRGRRQIESVKSGDYLVFYVMPKRIGGIFKAASEPFESSEKIFSWAEFGREEIFPHRIRLEPIDVPKEPVPIEALLSKISFTRGRKRWSVFLRRAMVELPTKDFELIRSFISGK